MAREGGFERWVVAVMGSWKKRGEIGGCEAMSGCWVGRGLNDRLLVEWVSIVGKIGWPVA